MSDLATSLRGAGWAKARPWHTNAALGLIGFAMIGYSRQLIAEWEHYNIGYDHVSSMQMLLYVGAILVLLLKPANVDRWTLPIIFTVAILCRLVVLFPEPFLSSDVYRYAWDGVVQHAHINPYRYVPGDKALTFLRAPNQDLFDNMNRRDYARTIYPPAAQMMFYVITFINPSVTFMKMGMVLLEVVTVWGLLQMLRLMGMRREWVLVYAWMPMLIWEIAGSGHLDSMAMAWIVLAMVARYKRQPVWTGVFLALAVLTKFYPLVLFPAFYQRGDWKMPATMAGLAAVLYAPYLSVGTMVFGFLGGYVQEEGMNTGTRYFPLQFVQSLPGLAGVSNTAYILFAALVFGALMVWAWRTGCREDSARGAFLWPAFGLALAMMLLFSPHYPWYVAWLVPFMVLLPSMTVTTYVGGLFYLCTTAWAVGTGPKQYHLNQMLYSSVAIALIVEIVVRRVPAVQAWLRRQRFAVIGLETSPEIP